MSKTILHIDSSPRGEASASRKLAQAIVDQVVARHPGARVTRRDLAAHPLPHLSPAHLNAFMAKPPEYTEDDRRAVDDSDRLIAELVAANVLIFGIPMWNFSVPSVLKSWIDHVARAGKTFRYTDKGPVGLLADKQVYLAIASGGVYGSGPMQPLDFVEPYMRAVMGFMGLKDVRAVRAEGLALPHLQAEALARGIAAIQVD